MKYDQRYWTDELSAFEKRAEQWHRKGNRVVDRYLDKEANDHSTVFRLNLFHNHISTLMAMLYGSVPKVDVSRRYADQNDDVARVSAELLQRILNTDIEEAGEDFASVLRGALQDRLLPGLGVARCRYKMNTQMIEHEAQMGMNGEVLVEAYEEEELLSETVEIDYVHWQDFAWGYARNWGEVPWVAFKSRMTKNEVKKRFGEKFVSKLQFTKAKPEEDSSEDDKDTQDTAAIWEIWCKDSKKVYWHQKGCDNLLDEEDDPLQLSGFWPCPPPMMANPTTRQFMPMPDFVLSQDLYNEVDHLQTRISTITKALKVVGVYDKSNEGVQRMLTEGFDNDLIPVDNWAMFAESGGLRGTIDWFPIEDVANTLDKLRNIRNETVQLLYQVSGLQDMMQGGLTGGQPTSATEQALRARFASVRVQFLQDDFARFASGLQTIKAEIMGRHFEPETIAKMSPMQNSPDQQMLPQSIQLIKQPDVMQWRVEIKPESIALIDYAQLKSERTEYLTAISTFLQSAQAAGKVSPALGPFLLELMKWGLAGFKGSSEIEGVVDRAVQALIQDIAKQQQSPEQNPEQMKMQGEMMKIKAKLEADLQKMQAKAVQEMQKLNASVQAELTKLQAQTQSKVQQEAAQAHYNILEKKAAGGRGES
jgi:hypothetical protein